MNSTAKLAPAQGLRANSRRGEDARCGTSSGLHSGGRSENLSLEIVLIGWKAAQYSKTRQAFIL